MTTSYIPPATAAELACPAAEGGRHQQALKIACSLIGNGMDAAEVISKLRSLYPDDVTDDELQKIVEWAAGQNFQPSGYGYQANNRMPGTTRTTTSIDSDTAPAAANVEKFLAGHRCTEDESIQRSPIKPATTPAGHALALLRHLYQPEHMVNVVTEYQEGRSTSGKVKYNPRGYGQTKCAVDWIAEIEQRDVPVGAAGVWLRMNPTDGQGIANRNVKSFRFALVEFDSVPLELQLPFLHRLPVPLAAIITSGGRSIHGWVAVNAANEAEYEKVVVELHRLLKPFGVDPSNKNPSRLSRLPGVIRRLGGTGTGQQRLLYCDPAAAKQSLDLMALTELLKPWYPKPAVEDEPDRPLFVPPLFTEVLKAISGSPLATYIKGVANMSNAPLEYLLVDAILLGCCVLATAERQIGLKPDPALDPTPRNCNGYIMKLGHSGTGKGLTTGVFKVLARSLGIEQLEGVSQAAICATMSAQNASRAMRFGVYYIPEISRILSPRDIVGTGIKIVFLENFDTNRISWNTANGGKPKNWTLSPFAPSLSVEGQPDLVERTCGNNNLDSGFLARFLVAAPPRQGKVQKTGTVDCPTILAAYESYQQGPQLIHRPKRIPEAPADLFFEHMSGAEAAVWQRLSPDYIPRIAALIAPVETMAGELSEESLVKAGIVVSWFFGQSQRLIGLVHNDPREMLRSRMEQFISQHHPTTTRTLLRHLKVSLREFRDIADTVVARGGAISAMQGRSEVWFPAKASVTGDTHSADSQTSLNEELALLHSYPLPHTNIIYIEKERKEVPAEDSVPEVVDFEAPNCRQSGVTSDTRPSGIGLDVY